MIYERYLWAALSFFLFICTCVGVLHSEYLDGKISLLEDQCTPRAEVEATLRLSERIFTIHEAFVRAGAVDKSTNWQRFLLPSAKEVMHDDGEVRNESFTGPGPGMRLVHAEAGDDCTATADLR